MQNFKKMNQKASVVKPAHELKSTGSVLSKMLCQCGDDMPEKLNFLRRMMRV